MKMAKSTEDRIKRQIAAFNVNVRGAEHGRLIVELHLGTETSATVELLDNHKRRIFWTQCRLVPQLCRLLNYVVYRNK